MSSPIFENLEPRRDAVVQDLKGSKSKKGPNLAEIVCAAFIDLDRVLLVRRAPHRKWSPNLWDLVGGHVEKGEGLDVALVRECEEEVGLTPLAFSHVATLYEEDDVERRSPFHVYAVPKWKGGRARLLGNEHSELGWFNLDEFSKANLAFAAYDPVVSELLRT